MLKCKWAGDTADEYCKDCNGIEMMVEGNQIPCDQCAGYEAGDEEVGATEDKAEKKADKGDKAVEEPKSTNSTPKKEKADKKGDTKQKKVAEEKKANEDVVVTPNGVVINSLRYTSGATIKRGDNYYKFIAEEEWNLQDYKGDIDDAREQLWAKLNLEVDRQIDALNDLQ